MQYFRFTLLFLLSLLFRNTAGVLTNVTVDDQSGDSLTGAKISYLPVNFQGATIWKSSLICDNCAIRPDTTQAFNGTWTSATYFAAVTNMTAGFDFGGTALYVYFILSNYPSQTGLISSTFCNFRLDGRIIGSFAHQSDGSYLYQYNQLAFSSVSLPDGNHTFLIETSGSTASYVIFDYAVYTTDVPVPMISSTPHAASTGSSAIPTSKVSPIPTRSKTDVGVIIGFTVFGIILVAVCGTVIVCCCRRRTGRLGETILTDIGENLTPYQVTRDEPTTISLDMRRQLETMTARLQALESQSQRPPTSAVSGSTSQMYTVSPIQPNGTSLTAPPALVAMSKRDWMLADQMTNRSTTMITSPVTTDSSMELPPRYSA